MISTETSLELKRLLARAKLINQYYEKDLDISFSSILLAFLINDDPISRWFSSYVKTMGINVGILLEERKVSQQILEDIASHTILPDQLPVFYRQTTSTAIYLGMAEKYRESLTRGDKTYPLQVHHLMAAYIYDPWISFTGALIRKLVEFLFNTNPYDVPARVRLPECRRV